MYFTALKEELAQYCGAVLNTTLIVVSSVGDNKYDNEGIFWSECVKEITKMYYMKAFVVAASWKGQNKLYPNSVNL